MIFKKLMARTLLIGPVLAAMLGVGILIGCTGDTGPGEGRDSGGATASRDISEREGGDSGGEHGGKGEGSEGSGGEGSGGESGSESTASGSEEGSGATLAPDETFDMVRSGARLILSYDAPSNSFKGTVENTTNNVLGQVRIEVHLSNGTELGPTTPVDMAPGEVVAINLLATQASFTGWVAHAEVGSQGSESGGGEGGGESGGESGGEGGEVAVVRVAVKVGAKPLVKPPCRARSLHSDSRGTAFSADWPSPRGTTRQPSPSTERCGTRSHRNSATCRPNLT